MVRVAAYRLYKSLKDWHLYISYFVLAVSYRLSWGHFLFAILLGSPQTMSTSLATSHRSTAIPGASWVASIPWHLSMHRDGYRYDYRIPHHIPASCNPMDLSFNTAAATETGLSLSWIHVFKQLGWSLASPISISTISSAHAGISVPVAIRSLNCHAGIRVTSLSPCLYTPLSLCQIQQGMWDANAFTPTCFV